MSPVLPNAVRRELDTLALIRDELRLHAHLGGTEVADRYRRAEVQWAHVRDAVDRAVDDAEARVTEALRLVREEYRHLVRPTQVREAMAHRPPTVRLDATADEVLDLLWREEIDCLAVVGEDGAVVGMVSDRDVAMAVHLRRALPSAIPVREITSPRWFSLTASEPVKAAELALLERGLRRAPVLDDAGGLLGVFALRRDPARP